jgi:hypothetical protein
MLPPTSNERMIMLLKPMCGPRRWRPSALTLTLTLMLAALISPATASAHTVQSPSFPFGRYGYGPRGNVVVNHVNALAQTSGQPVFKVKYQFHVGFAPTLSAVNRADALTECAGCHSIAIGFQIVTTTKRNLAALHSLNVATATDTACAPGCSAVADAYQVVVATDTPSPLALDWIVDPDQRVTMSGIRSEFLALPHSGLTVSQVQSRCEDLVRQAIAILRSGSDEAPGNAAFTRPSSPSARSGASELTRRHAPIVRLYRDIKLDPQTAG